MTNAPSTAKKYESTTVTSDKARALCDRLLRVHHASLWSGEARSAARAARWLRGKDRYYYYCIATVVGSLVMLSITDANPNTPDPDCTVILAYPRSIAVCPATFLNGCVACDH